MEENRHEINFQELIVNGDSIQKTVQEYERRGYVLLHQGPAALLHPKAMPNDTILVFALPIGERAYDRYYGSEIDSSTSYLN